MCQCGLRRRLERSSGRLPCEQLFGLGQGVWRIFPRLTILLFLSFEICRCFKLSDCLIVRLTGFRFDLVAQFLRFGDLLFLSQEPLRGELSSRIGNRGTLRDRSRRANRVGILCLAGAGCGILLRLRAEKAAPASDIRDDHP